MIAPPAKIMNANGQNEISFRETATVDFPTLIALLINESSCSRTFFRSSSKAEMARKKGLQTAKHYELKFPLLFPFVFEVMNMSCVLMKVFDLIDD